MVNETANRRHLPFKLWQVPVFLWWRAKRWRRTLVAAVVLSVMAVVYPLPLHVWRDNYAPNPMDAEPGKAITTTSSPETNALAGLIPKTDMVHVTPTRPMVDEVISFGQTRTKLVPFAGHLLPLPPGDWKVIALVPVTRNDGVVINLAALEQVKDKVLAGLVILIGNDASVRPADGFPADNDCQRSDLLYTETISNNDRGSQECRIIDFLPGDRFTQPGNDPLLHAALSEILKENLRLPTAMVGPSFHISDRKSLLVMEALFNPEIEGITPSGELPWNDNDWNKYRIDGFPEKKAYLKRLIDWSTGWAPFIRTAWIDGTDLYDSKDPVLAKAP